MGYFTRTTVASGSSSSTSDQVLFTSGATGVQSKTDTDVGRVALHVDGSMSCTDKLHINEIEADMLVETSDPRKKQHMVPMSDAQGDVALAITPFMYELRSRPGELHAGVDAQKLAQVAPHAVRTSAKGDLAVSYRMISMHALQLQQQQHRQLQVQTRQIATLRNELNKLVGAHQAVAPS